MNLNVRILQTIVNAPGTCRKNLGVLFHLSDYRLKRVFRNIERDLTGQTLVYGEGNGVWIVPVDPTRCLGMEWVGKTEGGTCNVPRSLSLRIDAVIATPVAKTPR